MSIPAKSKPRPEHERLSEIKDRSQAIGEFLEWMQTTKRIRLATSHVHTDDCSKWCEREFEVFTPSTEKLLAEYFEIDLNKLELEKRRMLAEIRKDRASREIDKELGIDSTT